MRALYTGIRKEQLRTITITAVELPPQIRTIKLRVVNDFDYADKYAGGKTECSFQLAFPYVQIYHFRIDQLKHAKALYATSMTFSKEPVRFRLDEVFMPTLPNICGRDSCSVCNLTLENVWEVVEGFWNSCFLIGDVDESFYEGLMDLSYIWEDFPGWQDFTRDMKSLDDILDVPFKKCGFWGYIANYFAPEFDSDLFNKLERECEGRNRQIGKAKERLLKLQGK